MTNPLFSHSTALIQDTLFAIPDQPALNSSLPQAVREEAVAESCSPRYGMVSSKTLVRNLTQVGFRIVGQEAGKGPSARHVLHLEHDRVKSHGTPLKLQSDYRVGVTITNSHNGETRYVASLSLHEGRTEYQIGSNWGHVGLKHGRLIAQTAIPATLELLNAAARIPEMLEQLRNVHVSQTDILELAKHAMLRRWKRPQISVMQILEGFEQGTLLEAIEHIQSRVITGGILTSNNRSTRNWRQPAHVVRFRRELWAEAEALACA